MDIGILVIGNLSILVFLPVAFWVVACILYTSILSVGLLPVALCMLALQSMAFCLLAFHLWCFVPDTRLIRRIAQNDLGDWEWFRNN